MRSSLAQHVEQGRFDMRTRRACVLSLNGNRKLLALCPNLPPLNSWDPDIFSTHFFSLEGDTSS